MLRNEKVDASDPRWKDDLTSVEGGNYPMPRRVPFSLAGSMQPIVATGRIFVADSQGHAYAIDADDGSTLWSAAISGGSLWPGVTDENTVAFGTLHGCLVALDASTGRPLWQFDTGKTITTAPALADGVLYAASQSGRVYALRLADGEPVWVSEYLGAPIQGGLCVHRGNVYTGTEAMEAIGLDAATGTVFARQKLMGQSFRLVWPVGAGDRVIFVTAGVVCVGSEYVNDPVLAGRPGPFGSIGWDPDLRPGYPDVASEEQAMRRWLAGDGKVWEQVFALRADDLRQDYIVATGATEGCGTPPNPPAIDGTGRPILWWASAYGTVIERCGFGTNFTTDISSFDLDTGRRVLIDNGRYADQTTETDNLYAMSIGGRYLYLRQNFRGTSAIDLTTSQHWRISAMYRRRDGGGWHSPVNYAQGDGGDVRTPATPRSTAGRVPPAVARGRLYFSESFGVTCVETDLEEPRQ